MRDFNKSKLKKAIFKNKDSLTINEKLQAIKLYKEELITPNEFYEIHRGNMVILTKENTLHIMNLNTDIPYIKTGESQELYKGRVKEIMINFILGEY